MKKTSMRFVVGMALLMASSIVSAQTTTSSVQPVTLDNYNRAQTDAHFTGWSRTAASGNSGMAARVQMIDTPPTMASLYRGTRPQAPCNVNAYCYRLD